MNLKKHMTNVQRQDIYLRYLYEDQQGYSVYAIHLLVDYRAAKAPLGTLTLKSGSTNIDIQWAAHMKKGALLSAVAPEGVSGDE